MIKMGNFGVFEAYFTSGAATNHRTLRDDIQPKYARSALEDSTPNVEVGFLRVVGCVQRSEGCSWQQDMEHRPPLAVMVGQGT